MSKESFYVDQYHEIKKFILENFSSDRDYDKVEATDLTMILERQITTIKELRKKLLKIEGWKDKITVKDFVEKFTISPFIDITPNFKLTKKLEVDAGSHEGCFNCEDKVNQRRLKSEAWTGVEYCWICKHLNVIYYQDRMGGVYYDVIHCYTEV